MQHGHVNERKVRRRDAAGICAINELNASAEYPRCRETEKRNFSTSTLQRDSKVHD